MDLLDTPLSRGLNRLLQEQGWARARLQPFAGESLAVRAPPMPELRLRIAADGTTRPDASVAPPSLTLTFSPAVLVALARGMEHAMREVDVAGNDRLAAEILFLARHLRWDVEEELSPVLGDALAHRIGADMRRAAHAVVEAGVRVSEAAMEYALDEARLLARREEHERLARENSRLRDGIDRLEARLEGLGGDPRG